MVEPPSGSPHVGGVTKNLPHPDRDQLELNRVLGCLGDPIRLAIVAGLGSAEAAAAEMRCRDFQHLGTKSNLSYHFDRLREAGIIYMRLVGTSRFLHLRRSDLDARFPGLLAIILVATASAPSSPRTT